MTKKPDPVNFYYSLDKFADEQGGRTKLTVLLQKRTRELIKGLPRLVDINSDDPVQIALEELFQGKIELAETFSELDMKTDEADEEKNALSEI